MVIAGDSKGQQGKVLKVDTEKSKAIVEGINMVSKHTKPNAKSPSGRDHKKRGPGSYFQSDGHRFYRQTNKDGQKSRHKEKHVSTLF